MTLPTPFAERGAAVTVFVSYADGDRVHLYRQYVPLHPPTHTEMSSCRCANSSPASVVAMSDAGRRLDHRRGGRRAGAWARPDGHPAPAGRTRRPIRSCACMTERVRTHAVARLGEDTSLKNVHTLLFPREGRRRAAAQRHEIRRVPTVARDQPRHGRSRGSRSPSDRYPPAYAACAEALEVLLGQLATALTRFA
jgi:hypothetical protein